MRVESTCLVFQFPIGKILGIVKGGVFRETKSEHSPLAPVYSLDGVFFGVVPSR